MNLRKLIFPHDGKPEHSPVLDGLRGLAVLLVLLSHAAASGYHALPILDFDRAGKFGVYLFFVLSAYLLDRQIALALMTGKANLRYWLNYLLRRFLRIIPLFAISLVSFFIADQTGAWPNAISSPTILFEHLTFQKGESIFWSIPTEFKYYFVSPLLMLFFHKVYKWKVIPIVLTILLLCVGTFLTGKLLEIREMGTFVCLPLFLMGTLVSIVELVKREQFKAFMENNRVLLEIAAWISIVVLFMLFRVHFAWLSGMNLPPWFFHSPKFFIPVALIWSTVLVAGKYTRGPLATFFSFKPLRYIGVISYSAYLFHLLILNLLVHPLPIPDYLKVYVLLALTSVICLLTYLGIEQPLSRIRIFRKPLTEAELAKKEKQA